MQHFASKATGRRDLFIDKRVTVADNKRQNHTGREKRSVSIKSALTRGDIIRHSFPSHEALPLYLGSGSAGAIAIAAQLQVDRLILIQPRKYTDKDNPFLTRSMNRLHAFARRYAFFCVADVLIADSAQMRRAWEITDSLVQCRISTMRLCGSDEKNICTNGESVFKTAIYRFLSTGELAKSLAENSEMCIIYE